MGWGPGWPRARAALLSGPPKRSLAVPCRAHSVNRSLRRDLVVREDHAPPDVFMEEEEPALAFELNA
jgi:hypothetical protein